MSGPRHRRHRRALLMLRHSQVKLNRSTMMSPFPLRVTLPDMASRRVDPSVPASWLRRRSCAIRD